jgi:putative flippase GtrA
MRLLVAERKVNYFIANVIAIVVCSLANFLLGDRFVFEKGAAESPSAL